MEHNNVKQIKKIFSDKLKYEEFVQDKSGVKTIEILSAQFIADEPTIFGSLDTTYVQKEMTWYLSKSLYVDDIPAPVPQIWKNIASTEGKINSNYGWAIYSEENGNQYNNVLKTLESNDNSRQAQMIYTRPTMHTDSCANGMKDFMCCSNTVSHIRNNTLTMSVYFRSMDAIFGYKNDIYWMNYVHNNLWRDLLPTYTNLKLGQIVVNAASLHVYERHFGLVK